MFRHKPVEFFRQAAGYQPGHVHLAQRPRRKGKQITGGLQKGIRRTRQLAVGLVKGIFRDAVACAKPLGPFPFCLLVGPLHNVAQQQIPHDHIIHLDGGDGFDQTCMAGVDEGFTFPLCLTAGFLVAKTAALLPFGSAAHQPAIGRQFRRVRQNVHSPLIKHHRAQAGQLVKIPQKYQQFSFIKYSTHSNPTFFLFFLSL